MIFKTSEPSGHGSAVSLQLIEVGKRHCRVLRFYDSGVTGIDTADSTFMKYTPIALLLP